MRSCVVVRMCGRMHELVTSLRVPEGSFEKATGHGQDTGRTRSGADALFCHRCLWLFVVRHCVLCVAIVVRGSFSVCFIGANVILSHLYLSIMCA